MHFVFVLFLSIAFGEVASFIKGYKNSKKNNPKTPRENGIPKKTQDKSLVS